jgi:ABC-type multidrug transport system ATPase subunit
LKELSKKVIVLLGPEGAGKSRFLLSVLNLPFNGLYLYSNPVAQGGGECIGYCSNQELVQPHLTVRENLRFFASLHGLEGWGRVDELLSQSDLLEYAERMRADLLPRSHLRTLQLLIALLPDPDLLLIDDLTAGLSLPARRKLWQVIKRMQISKPRVVIYATRDLEASRFLADEVWWIENDQIGPVWLVEDLPALFRASAIYAIDLRSSKTAQKYLEDISDYEPVQNYRLIPPKTVEVMVRDKSEIITLTWKAGANLAAFRTLPLEADNLLSQFSVVGMPSTSPEMFSLPSSKTEKELKPALSSRQVWIAIVEIGRIIWREHFRSFWKAGNVLFSGIFSLTVIQVVLSKSHNLETLLQVSPLVLMLSSTMIFGLGLESISRLTTMGGIGNLFQTVQARNAARPFSLLALVDLTSLRRRDLLAGITLGQLAVVSAHAWPILFWECMLYFVSSISPWLLAAGLLFWLMTSIVSLALMVLVSGILPIPRWGIWVGWFLWLFIPLSSWFLPRDFPILWFWPFTGFSVVLEGILDLTKMWIPFACACLGTVALCLCAAQAFYQRPSIWSIKR